MSLRTLNIMVNRAITSDQFRKGMMNGSRAELIREYDLDPDERAEIMAIQANTETEFYRAMDRIILARDESRRLSFLTDRRAGIGHSLDVTARHVAARVSISAG